MHRWSPTARRVGLPSPLEKRRRDVTRKPPGDPASPPLECDTQFPPIKFNVCPPDVGGDDDILRFGPEAGPARKIDKVSHLVSRENPEKERRAFSKKLSESASRDSALLQPKGSLIQRDQQLDRHKHASAWYVCVHFPV